MPDPDNVAHIVSDGRYYIKSADGKFTLQTGAAVNADNGDTQQASVITGNDISWTELEYDRNMQWTLAQIDENYYTITNFMDGRILKLENDSLERGVKVVAEKLDGATPGDNAKWYIKQNDDGQYYICSKYNGMYLSFSKVEAGQTPVVYTKMTAMSRRTTLRLLRRLRKQASI